jgi:hypothetical protein
MIKPTDPKYERIAKRRERQRDAHADTQSRYRAKMAEKNGADREDFGRAALTIILLLCKNVENDFTISLRKSVIDQLVKVGFDRDEANAKFDRMRERAADDSDAWKRYRHWLRNKKIANSNITG